MNKFLIAAFAFTIIVVGAQGPGGPKSDEYKKYIEECKAEIGASDDDIRGMMTQQSPSEKTWCMIGCIHKKSGVMGADNKINMDKLKEEKTPMKENNPAGFEKLISATQECKTQTEAVATNLASECTAAKALGECMKSKM